MSLAASAVLRSGLAGCGDGDDPQADPTPSTSSHSETESSPTDEPTEPEVEPATGSTGRHQAILLPEAARQADDEGKRQDDIDLDGEPAYHFSASSPPVSDESLGRWREPFDLITIGFGTFGTNRAEREALMASVLATCGWRS